MRAQSIPNSSVRPVPEAPVAVRPFAEESVVNDTVFSRSPVYLLALAGAVLVWLAQPPVAISLIAWISLVPWGLLISRHRPLGTRGWWMIWGAGAVYWLVTMQGVRLAHPALYPAWIVLGAYLGIYPVLGVFVGRVLHRDWSCPVWLALAISWTGLEVLRSYAFTGFSAVMLGHSQADIPLLIQIADLGGTYVVTFMLALVSGVVASIISNPRAFARPVARNLIGHSRSTAIGVGISIAVVLFAIGYGQWRLHQGNVLATADPMLKVLLIQRNEPLEFSLDPQTEADAFNRYIQFTIEAASKSKDVDLIVWPESMFTGGFPYQVAGENLTVPEEALNPNTGNLLSVSDFARLISLQGEIFEQRADSLRQMLGAQAGRKSIPELLVGCSVYEYTDEARVYGGAVHIDENSKVAGWYGKMHLVMFGEYIPFGTYFPWLYKIGPLRQGATPGKRPIAMEIAGVGIAPNICFETMVEQVTGNGLRQLRRRGESPDVIVNVTNDAWFHGTAILSHHRRCSQLVAVCNRRPLLMNANQGPTTWIDGCGRRIQSLEYETNAFIVAEPTRDGRSSLYAFVGDAPSWTLTVLCSCAVIHRVCRRRRKEVVALTE